MREPWQLVPSLESLLVQLAPRVPWGLSFPICKVRLTALWKS